MSDTRRGKTLPGLRFPGFDGEWEVKKLGELAKKITLKNKEGKIMRVLTNSAVDGVVDQRDYFEKDIANKNNLNGYSVVERGDYVYNPRISNLAPLGPISKNKAALGIMSPLYTVFRFKNKLDDFYEQYFKSTYWHKYMHQISNSGARHDRISVANNQFMDMPLPFPSPQEQQKIADCLSSMDELITAQTEKLDALNAHKKALMQQLFPAEGKTLPGLRFPGFDGEWEVKNGNEIFDQISNKEHDSNLPVLAITQEHGAIPRDAIDYRVSVSEQSIKNYKVVESGDFIISLRSFQGGIEYSNHKGLCSPAYIILRKKGNELEYYFKHYFKTEKSIKDLNKNIEGLRDGKMVSYKQFSDVLLPVPLKLEEQQKIADCLSSMDELITAQTEKLDALNAHKKALMQQLFPSVDEATG